MIDNKTEFEIDNNLHEFVGVIIGDGCLYGNFNKYLIMITGNVQKDRDYYETLSDYLRSINLNPRIKIHWNGLRLIIQNKGFYNFIKEEFNLNYKKSKTLEARIPDKTLKSSNSAKFAFLRGIFNSDGSVFTSHKPGSPNYPSIEITTISMDLATGLEKMLGKFGFRVKLRHHDPKNGNQRIYKTSINGWGMIRKWYNEIGFTHLEKRRKAEDIIRNKYGVSGI